MSPLEDQSTVLTLMQPGRCLRALLACAQLAVLTGRASLQCTMYSGALPSWGRAFPLSFLNFTECLPALSSSLPVSLRIAAPAWGCIGRSPHFGIGELAEGALHHLLQVSDKDVQEVRS